MSENEKKECQCHECHEAHKSHECHECHCHECEEDENCSCDCCGPPPTLLEPLLKVEGASKVDVFTKGVCSEAEEDASSGDHVKITFPPNSYITTGSFIVTSPVSKIEVKINNKGAVVYKEESEIESLTEVIIDYKGDLEEILIDNLDKSHPLKIGGFMLCGARSDVCSIFQTRQSSFLQPLYHCNTCKFEEGQCVCKACADKCHSGHDLREMSTTGFCDCPDICECKNTIPEDDECTYGENGPEPISQKLFICKTCGFKGKQRCCEACAKYCHSGHDVELAQESYGKCACGGQSAPGNPCLFIPQVDDSFKSCSYTKHGDKPVSQEMFVCETCKFKEGQMMCIGCALACHVSHKIVKIGIKEGVCACGKHEIEDNSCHLTNDPRPRKITIVGCPCCAGMH